MKKIIILLLILIVPVTVIITAVSSSRVINFIGSNFGNSYLEEFGIQFDQFNLSVKNDSLSQKRYQVELIDRCVRYKKNRLCIDRLKLAIKINLLKPMDFTIEQLKINLKKQTISLPLEEGVVKKKESLDLRLSSVIESIIELSKTNKANNIEINIHDFKLLTPEGSKNIDVTVKSKAQNLYVANISYKDNKLLFKSIINIENLKKGLDLRFQNSLLYEKKSYELGLNLSLSKKENKIKLTPFTLDISNKAKFEFGGCQSSFTLGHNIEIECPNLNLHTKLNGNYSFKSKLSIHVPNLISTKTESIIKINALGITENTNFMEIDYDFLAQYNLASSKFAIEKFDLNILIDKFKNAQEILSSFKVPLPAPLNKLKGRIKLTASIKDVMDKYKVPIKGVFELDKAKNVKLNSEVSAQLEMTKEFKPKSIKIKKTIKNFMVNIPYLDPIKGFPSFSSSRIKKNISFSKKKDKQALIPYEVQILSSNNSSLKLYNPLFKPYFAFGIDVSATEKKLEYNILSYKKSNLQYLKRRINLQKIEIKKKGKNSFIDSILTYKTAGYDIFLKVIGKLDQPQLILSSYPSLNNEDIISLLIYGRKSNELTSYNKESVGSTEEAISDRALGLFSIWAFASTPIDSVSYNPRNKTYSATVSLPNGTSLSIGTDWDSASSLSLRKRLSDTWAVVTSYGPSESGAKESIKLQKEISF